MAIGAHARGAKELRTVAATQPRAVSAKPRVVRMSPRGNAVTTTRPIVIQFSRRMNRGAVRRSVAITPAVRCIWRWNTASTRLTCRHAARLRSGTVYRVTVARKARSAAGVRLRRSVVHRFRTAPPTTPPPPTPPPVAPGPIVETGVPIGNSTAFRITRPAGVTGDVNVTVGSLPPGVVAPANVVLPAGANEVWYPVGATTSASPGTVAVTFAVGGKAETRQLPLLRRQRGGLEGIGSAGINVDGPDDWANKLFADAAKQARPWVEITGPFGVRLPPADLDANGWPTRDGRLLMFAIRRAGGTYALRFTGTANVSAFGGTVSGLSYDAASNTTSGTLTVPILPELDENIVWLDFPASRRTAASALNTGVTNVSLMRPQTEGGSVPYPFGTTFTNEAKGYYSHFSTLRMMGAQGTNWSIIRTWADRPFPSDSSQAKIHAKTGFTEEVVNGFALEYQIQLCNETQRDCWFNVPELADDDYVRRMAQMIQTQLDPSLRAYIEYSNEVWNPTFPAWHHTLREARAEVAASPASPLAFDGSTDQYVWRVRWFARRSVQISDIFRQVVGDSQMMTRIRPVLESQLVITYDDDLALGFLEGYYNNPRFAANPRPPWDYFYAIGGATYAGVDAVDNINTVEGAFAKDWDIFPEGRLSTKIVDEKHRAISYGVRYASYEGGPSLWGDISGAQNPNNPTSNALRYQIRLDPRFLGKVAGLHNLFLQAGGDLDVVFGPANGYIGAWSLLNDLADQNNPQRNYGLRGIDQASTTTRPVVFLGTALPATLNPRAPATDTAAPEFTRGNSTTFGRAATDTLAFTAHTTTARTVTVTVNGLAVGAAAIALFVDGSFAGFLELPNGATTSTPLTVVLAAGSHSLRFEPGVGEARLDAVAAR